MNTGQCSDACMHHIPSQNQIKTLVWKKENDFWLCFKKEYKYLIPPFRYVCGSALTVKLQKPSNILFLPPHFSLHILSFYLFIATLIY